MKKIIHLSDIHLGCQDCDQKFEILVNRIISQFQPDKYLIVITGDTIDNARNNINWTRAKTLIDRLIQGGFKTLIIPGNHDYGTGMAADPRFVDIFKDTFYGERGGHYPKVDTDEGVVFIGLDSNEDELHWYDRFFAEGEIGRRQLSELKEIINDTAYTGMRKVVYFHHHPIDFFFFRHLKDGRKLKRVIRGKADALLFGHNHNKMMWTYRDLNGKWGIPRVYNAGSATHKSGTIGFHRVIDLSMPPSADYDAMLI